MSLKKVLIALNILNVADALFTAHSITKYEQYGAYEANPLMAALININIETFIIVKILLVLIMTGVFYKTIKQYWNWKSIKALVYFDVVMYSLVVIWHIFWITYIECFL